MTISVIGKSQFFYTSEKDISDHILLNRRADLQKIVYPEIDRTFPELAFSERYEQKEKFINLILNDYGWEENPNLFGRKSRIENVFFKLVEPNLNKKNTEEDICRYVLTNHEENLDNEILKFTVLDAYGWSSEDRSSLRKVETAIEQARVFIKMQQSSQMRAEILSEKQKFNPMKYLLFKKEIALCMDFPATFLSEKKPIIRVSDLTKETKIWKRKLDHWNRGLVDSRVGTQLILAEKFAQTQMQDDLNNAQLERALEKAKELPVSNDAVRVVYTEESAQKDLKDAQLNKEIELRKRKLDLQYERLKNPNSTMQLASTEEFDQKDAVDKSGKLFDEQEKAFKLTRLHKNITKRSSDSVKQPDQFSANEPSDHEPKKVNISKFIRPGRIQIDAST